MIRPGEGLGRLRERFDAVLLDMDGTLLDDHGQVTPRTHRAVRQLADAGLMVVLCTGRSPQGVSEVHDDLGLTTPIVAYNGSWIGPAGGAPERLIDLAPERVHDLVPVEARADFGFRHEATTKWTVASDHADHPSVAAWYSNVRFAGGWHEMPLHGLLRLTLFFDLPADHVGGVPPHESAWSELSSEAAALLRRETFPLSLFRPYRHSRLHMLEIQAASRGKAEALVWLAEQHGIAADRAIAIGDHVNDLPMLEAAGLAIAMGNAVPDAKARADLVLASNDEDGIARWIEAGAPLPRAGDGRERS
ncbi:MAG: HAD-IIB family hydrolase [Planctomycetota bacterium]